MLADHAASTNPNIIKDLNPYHFDGTEVDHILDQYDKVLSQEPTSYDEHFAHYHYAFSANILYNEHKVTPHFRKWPGYMEIFFRRLGQLHDDFIRELRPNLVAPSLPTLPVPSPLASDTTVLPKTTTVLSKTRANDLLRDPFTLVDQVFVLQPGTEEAALWKVVTFTMKENRQMEYGVQLADCDGPIPMDQDELISLMMDSQQIE